MRFRWYRTFTVSFLVLLAAACAPSRPPEPSNLFWPAPPEQPRIRYVQSIYNEDDIGREPTFFERLFGKQYDDSISRPYGVFARNNNLIVTDLRKRGVLIFDLAAKRMSSLGETGSFRRRLPRSGIPQGRSTLRTQAGTAFCSMTARASMLPRSRSRTASRLLSRSMTEQAGSMSWTGKATASLCCPLKAKNFCLSGAGKRGWQVQRSLGIALDAENRVYVLDRGNFRVQQFDENGKFLLKFGGAGDRHGFFSNPKGIAVDSENHIYVTDAAFNNFQIFSQQGKSSWPWQDGSAPGYLYLPGGIAIDENDRIYVADQFNAASRSSSI